ncbi:hypothetical protein ACH4NT_36635 [Streptomyces lydicus]|uniref:hypothetical protein n=1 Tax=Streptomyces lydicus TaxID=47763 RepID=UPI0037A50DB2
MSTTTEDLDLDAEVEEDLADDLDTDIEPEFAPEAQAVRSATPTPHVPGGIPAVPLTVIGANSTVAAVSAAVVAAGPVPAGLAAAGLAVTAVGASALKRRSATRQAAAAGKSGGKPGNASGRTGNASGGSARGGPTAGGGRGRGGANSRTGSAGPGKSGARAMRAAGQAAKQSGRDKPGKGPLGAVKAARDARKAAAPTRADRRAKDTADSRRLADARRAAKAARKAEKKAAKGKGPKAAGASGGKSLNLKKSPKSGETGGRGPQEKATRGKDKKAGGKDGAGQLSMRERARQAKRRVRETARRARDERTKRRLGRMRALRKRARARARMWRRLTASALRCYARKALAVAISLPFVAIGLVSHPLGKWLGWKWLQYPGPRIYRRLAAAANRARQERDRDICDEYEAAAEAADDDQDDEPIAATVRRAPRNYGAHSGANTGGSRMSTPAGPGFLFNESAADMESAAQNYDPDGMMHVHDTIEGFPAALESVANTFAVLAQKSDEEFPLEPEVGEALDSIYKALQHAIDEAEEAFKTFRLVHEQDIRRHEEPRNNAEEGWDTNNN